MPAADSIQFVFNEREIDRKNGRLALWAFTPRKEAGRLCLSTCQDDNLSSNDAWALGERLRAFKQTKKKSPGPVTLLGRAEMTAATYDKRSLDFEAAPSTAVPEHVNVVGWEQAAINLESTHEQIALNISMESLFVPTPQIP